MQKFELFEIASVNNHLPIPMYFITSLYDGSEIEGGFYESELVKVDCLRIKVIREKGDSILVRWMDDPTKPTSWLSKEKKNEMCES